MDKEFKKIFDSLRKAEEKTDKIFKVMNGYQDYLDVAVKEGLLSEHEARMDFFSRTMELLRSVANAEERINDDDAEDEPCDCDDDDEDECDDSMFPETAEEKAHRKALDRFAKCMRDSGFGDISFTYVGHVDRRKNRG